MYIIILISLNYFRTRTPHGWQDVWNGSTVGFVEDIECSAGAVLVVLYRERWRYTGHEAKLFQYNEADGKKQKFWKSKKLGMWNKKIWNIECVGISMQNEGHICMLDEDIL